MRQESIFTNARIVTADKVIEGTLRTKDGVIVEIAEGASRSSEAIDLEGDYLIPGLIELHTDNLEKHFVPRPGVRWPALAAVTAHDAQVAAAGITTVYDAVTVGQTAAGGDRMSFLRDMVDTIAAAQKREVLRITHRLHLRCEVSYENCPGLFETFLDHSLLDMASLMDHTPGQRQFTSLESYRNYYQKKYAWSDEEFSRFAVKQKAAHETHAGPNRRKIVAMAKERGLTLASHDDATLAHVDEAISEGMAIAEFPTTFEAAEASHKAGMQVLMGAPNVVRGKSHSGNLSSRDLAERRMLDIISSDYMPVSLVHAAFLLGESGAGFTLPEGIAMASKTPARAVGIKDRGEIAVGQRADLAQVRKVDDLPLVRQVWRDAVRVI